MKSRLKNGDIWRRLTSRKMSRVASIAAMTGTVVLLVAVALLQYRWNSQIRRSAESRLGSDLESAMLTWHMDLYREFTTICFALQVGPDSGARDEWNDYLRRYEEWRRASTNPSSVENIYSNPDIVSDIYVFEASRGPQARLLRFNTDKDIVDKSVEPPGLQGLLARLRGRSANLRQALSGWAQDSSFQTGQPQPGTREARNSPTIPVTGWQFDEAVPALVHPIVHHGRRAPSVRAPVDWLVVVLNRKTIESRIFPELAERYFGGTEGLQYRLAVVAIGERPRLLYSSDAGYGIDNLNSAESVMNIFGPPPESTEGSFWPVAKHRASLRGDEWRRFSAPVWFAVISETSQTWVLFLQHRTGSLEGATKRAWRGNLLLGGIILLLLAISLVLMVINAQRARALAAMQVSFVASISHELRSPLAVVLAAGQNLTAGVASDQSRYGAIITTQARQLTTLVDQILLFAALRDGKKQYHLEPVNLAEVVNMLRDTVFSPLEQSGFVVDLRIPENLPCALADKQALLRCLHNLVDNAAKYSGNSQWIGVSAGLVESSHRGQELWIDVADCGFGISSSELQHILEPFYRGSRATASQIRGSGLGLWVVNQIVTDLAGRLTVTSRADAGSIFTLHLQVVASDRCNLVDEQAMRLG
jgi:signal transduction histidine kinase